MANRIAIIISIVIIILIILIFSFLFFTSGWGYVFLKLYVINPVSYPVYKLFFSHKMPACVFTPQYSPDNKKIIFWTDINNDHNNSIYLYDLDRRIIQKLAEGNKPFYSGNGKNIFYLNNNELFKIDAEDNSLKKMSMFKFTYYDINNIISDYSGKNIYFEHIKHHSNYCILTKLNLETLKITELYKVKAAGFDNFIINQKDEIIALNDIGYDWDTPITEIYPEIVIISQKNNQTKKLDINFKSCDVDNPSLIFSYNFNDQIYVNNYEKVYKIDLTNNRVDIIADYFGRFNCYGISMSNDKKELLYLKDYFYSDRDNKKYLYKYDIESGRSGKIDLTYSMLKKLE